MNTASRDGWDTINNTHNRSARRKEGKKWAERICEEIMAEKLPKFDENINLYIQEAQQPPSSINLEISKHRHIRLSVSKDKKREF